MNCADLHERARRDPDAFALLIQIGSMPGWDENDNETILQLANCPHCNTTLARATKERS